MNAPEKIFIEITPDGKKYYHDVIKEIKTRDSDIEYIRTDVVAKRLLHMLNISSDNQHFFEQLDDYIDELENKE